MKKYLFITLLIVNFSNIYPQFGGGAGTEGNPYQISTAEHLAALATNVNAGTTYANTYFKLMNDIDLSSYLSGAGNNSGAFWLPIGNSTYNFYGKFDGNWKIISNLKINRPSSDNIGLFGVIHNAFGGYVKNLGVTIDAGGNVTGRQTVGGMIGDNRATIENCYVSGTVIGYAYVGGFAGYQNGFIRKCSSSGLVSKSTSANGYFGGFIGGNSGTIENCYSRSYVSASSLSNVGGFAGENFYATITNSYSTGYVDATTTSTVGGFIGRYDYGTITKCFWDTETSGKESSQGGTEVTGKTTSQMQTNTTFTNAGWDAAIWNIGDGVNDGYPYLDWQNTSGTPLPVELTSFSASFAENKVVLNWQTVTEVNNYGFEILRSAQNDKWEKIGFVNGHGNSNSPKSYSFTDSNPPSGKVAYRLKQIDFDGKYEYSDVVEVNVEAPNQFSLQQNYPNPFNPVTTIQYSIPGNVETLQATSLRVYDILGREVAVLVNQKLAAGNYEVKFDASHTEQGRSMASGVYLYKLQSGSFIQTKKFVLMK